MTRLLPVALLVAGIFWVIRLIAVGRASIRTPLDWPIGLFILLMPMTLVVTPTPVETREQVYRLLSGIALYYAIVNSRQSDRQVSLLFYATIALGALMALSTPLIASGSPSKFQLIPAVFYSQRSAFITDVVNFNVMAGLLVLFLPIPVAVLLSGDTSLQRWQIVLAGLAALLLTLMLVWTQSRGAWIASVAVGLLLVSLRWRWGWIAIAITSALLFLITQFPGVATVLNPLAVEGPGNSLGDRVQIWKRALGMMHDFPFTGIGLGAFGHVANSLYPFFVVPAPFPHAHNLFLQVAVDLGIAGLLVWLACVGTVGVCAWRLRQFGLHTNHTTATIYGTAMLGTLTALVVHGLTDAVTWGMVRPAVVVWGFWGFTIVAYMSHVRAVVDQRATAHVSTKTAAISPHPASPREELT